MKKAVPIRKKFAIFTRSTCNEVFSKNTYFEEYLRTAASEVT